MAKRGLTMNPLMKQAYQSWSGSDLQSWELSAGRKGEQHGVFPEEFFSCSAENGAIELLSPNHLNIPADRIRTVEFRCRSTGGKACLFWETEDGKIRRTQPAVISLESGPDAHDYQIELSQNPGWEGSIKRLRLVFEETGCVSIQWIMMTGVYFVPFVFLSGHHDEDKAILEDVKSAFPCSKKTAVIGFSIHLEFLSNADENGRYKLESGGIASAEYLVRLAHETEMPVCFWLRGDPWGYQTGGAYSVLWTDNSMVMWTAAADETRFYRNDQSGYGYLCMAEQELDGSKTRYWELTERSLGECAGEISRLIREFPGCVLAVTTTSEYKFNPQEDQIDLDYNPKTAAEFRDYCKRNCNGDLAAFNRAMGLDFKTWDLRFDLRMNETPGGFDPPRRRSVPLLFWQEWARFRGLQIKNAVRHQVDIITKNLDRKYIYTHQICSAFDPACSPIEAGNIPGSNMGIDMFLHETTEEHLEEITRAIQNDPSRSWGCPEWIPMSNASVESVLISLNRMHRAGIKYLSLLAWGCGEPFDIKGSPSETASRRFLQELDSGL